MKTIICLLLLFSYKSFCQVNDSAERKKIYHLSYISGSIIIAGGLASDYPSIDRIKGKADLTTNEMAALNINIINPIDQWALHQPTSDYQLYSKISDDIQPPLYVILPALLGLDKKIRKNWFQLLFMYCEGHVITFTFYNYSWFGPTFQNRYRPITYYANLPLNDRTTGNNRNSAYSGHTASTAYTSFFITKVYCDYHPELGFGKYLLYTAALVPPLAMGYLRVRSLAHFPSDVFTGLAIGSLVGVILPELHKYKCKNIALGMIDIPGAMGLDVCWTLPQPKIDLL